MAKVAGKERTILVIEDDTALRHVLADALQFEDYRVMQSGTVAGGLQQAQREHPDLILLDLGLAGDSGIELLNEIKCSAQMNEIPVLIMSSSALVLAGSALRHADGTVAKPFDLTELLERVDRLTRGAFVAITAN